MSVLTYASNRIEFDQIFYPILELEFSRNGILSISPYCFGLQAVDTTIDTTNNIAFKSVGLLELTLGTGQV